MLMNLVAWEDINTCRVEVRLCCTRIGEVPDLVVVAVAHQQGPEIGEAPPLASVSVKCSAMRLRSLDAAIIHALYVLDSQLAKNEFEGVNKK